MKCSECDSSNIDGADECWSCGASLRPAKIVKGGENDWILWTVAGAAVLVVLGLFMSSATGPTGGSSRGSGSTAATSSVPATGGAGPSAPASGTPAASSSAQP